MTTFFIRAWGKQNKVFSWNCSGGLIHENSSPELTDGFLKRFLFGKKLIAYKREEHWFIYLKNNEVAVQKIEKVEFQCFGPFSKLTLLVEGQKYSFFDLTLFDFFASKFDPTYDLLDSELVFGRWLVDLFCNTK
jgi:hypothetical protein